MTEDRITFVNGRILDAGGERSGDVTIDTHTGRIVAVGTASAAEAATEVLGNAIDIAGCVITPAFVDLAAHLGEPGHEGAETIATGARAAARGGFGAVVVMADTEPAIDGVEVVARIHALAREAVCEIVPAAALSRGRGGTDLAPLAELAAAGVRVFSDNPAAIDDTRFMRRVLEYVGSLTTGDGTRPVVAQTPRTAALAAGTAMHEGAWSVRLGLAGEPAEAEEIMVLRDLALSRLTGVGLHFQQLSTAAAVAHVRAAKAAGLAVTADTAPQYFSLTDAACADYDPRFKVAPPLRGVEDVAAVRAGLADGTIDAIASHHTPTMPDAKEHPFDQAATGMIGLETVLAVALADSGLALVDLVDRLAIRPAAIAGLAHRHGRPIAPGEPANLTVIDPEVVWTVRGRDFASKSTLSPFEGRQLKGKVRHTVHNGALVVHNGLIAYDLMARDEVAR